MQIFFSSVQSLKEDIKVLDCGVAGGGFAKDLYEASIKTSTVLILMIFISRQ